MAILKLLQIAVAFKVVRKVRLPAHEGTARGQRELCRWVLFSPSEEEDL